ncbi:hypothetical protein [Kitasatospora sp. NPDC050463]|uniref:hypothetical protein n=1 Tax=Kitasatospora sp. NPDC050463 TaxID=3155786 RepID=UPI0033D62E0C
MLRAGSSEDESGRGLILVKSLSSRWGCCPRQGVGKIVWAEYGPEVTVESTSVTSSEECAA